MVLHRDEGDVVLVRPGADAPGLTAQELAGRWADVDAPEVVLDLAAEGTLSGSDGCNRLMGSWELHDGRLQWQGGLATTRMHCPGVDTWLSGSAFAQPRGFGSWLRILDADGVELGHLQRSAPDAADPSATPDPGGS
ncbi:META domain-containing protein [Mycetocola reblochoni]|uniref:META domain-containing protein n=1 Tax=Mycetocola reblochoni TaxID=331618 RepID=A0A3L6ZQF7_9MICO|nr:META domain-containing protein [Mycetocola reblochoni]